MLAACLCCWQASVAEHGVQWLAQHGLGSAREDGHGQDPLSCCCWAARIWKNDASCLAPAACSAGHARGPRSWATACACLFVSRCLMILCRTLIKKLGFDLLLRQCVLSCGDAHTQALGARPAAVLGAHCSNTRCPASTRTGGVVCGVHSVRQRSAPPRCSCGTR